MTRRKITPADGGANLVALYVLAPLAVGLPGGGYTADSAFEQRTQVVRKGLNVAPATGFADWNFHQTAASKRQLRKWKLYPLRLSGVSGANWRFGLHQKGLADHADDRGGKGWGDFDVQGTVGVPIPTANRHAIGTAIVSSLTLQYFIGPYF